MGITSGNRFIYGVRAGETDVFVAALSAPQADANARVFAIREELNADWSRDGQQLAIFLAVVGELRPGGAGYCDSRHSLPARSASYSRGSRIWSRFDGRRMARRCWSAAVTEKAAGAVHR